MQRRITIALNPDDYNFIAQDYTEGVDSRHYIGNFIAESVKKAIEERRASKKEDKKVNVSIIAIN
jgi:hypothetical protein